MLLLRPFVSCITGVNSCDGQCIHNLHCTQDAYSGAAGKEPLLGELFVQYIQFFKLSTQYANNYDVAVKFLNDVASSSSYERFQVPHYVCQSAGPSTCRLHLPLVTSLTVAMAHAELRAGAQE